MVAVVAVGIVVRHAGNSIVIFLNDSARNSYCQAAGWNFAVVGYQRECSHHCVFANHGAVENDCVHADEGTFLDD